MNVDQAAVFLAGSVLIILAFVFIVAGLCVINNLIHKYWKPVRVFTVDSFTMLGTNTSINSKYQTPEQSNEANNSKDKK
jgi:hypothetical protein